MVAGVHAFEAWALYPLIYANKLKLHPLLVLVSLYVTEHLFGVQVVNEAAHALKATHTFVRAFVGLFAHAHLHASSDASGVSQDYVLVE